MDYKVWISVLKGYTKPSTPKSEWGRSEMEAYSANLKALNDICRALSSDDLYRVGALRTAKKVWDLIEKTYKSVSISSRDEILLSEKST